MAVDIGRGLTVGALGGVHGYLAGQLMGAGTSFVVPGAVIGAALGVSPAGSAASKAAYGLLGPALTGFFGYKDYKELRKEGYGVIASAMIATARQLPFLMIHGAFGNTALIAAQLAVPLGRAAFDLVGVKRRTQLVPFAHRWEWSDTATRAMQHVNASMSGGYFQGNEAAAMAQRYMREP